MANEIGLIEFSTLLKAAVADDWETAKGIFGEEENVFYKWVEFVDNSYTPLHVAVGTNSSHRFVEELAEWIMRVGGLQMLRIRADRGRNALHCAAMVGNTRAARLLIKKDPEMAQMTDGDGWTAVSLAAAARRKETLCYLLEVTKDEIHEEGRTSPFRGVLGAELLRCTIHGGFYDVALYLVKNYPELVTEKNSFSTEALQVLALKPDAFHSGSKSGFWHRIIYSWIPVNKKKALKSPISEPSEMITTQNRTYLQASYGFIVSFWSVLQYLAPHIKQMHESKVTHVQSKELVERMCLYVMNKGDKSLALSVFGRALNVAVKHGIYELIEQCCRHYPVVVAYKVKGMNLFMAAISERQEKVYNLVYQMSEHKLFLSAEHAPERNNALHIAGKLAPPHRLNMVTGAALQVQRELQWFKAGSYFDLFKYMEERYHPERTYNRVQEVEKFVFPSFEGELNFKKKTPRMVFSDEHKELLQEAKQWMKDTSSSATVVAALIVTIAFAAIFTAPGGNNNNGKPFFLNDGVFILFVISDAIALFSSSTSVMMLLAVLSSRFAEEDFLYSLPKRLTLGLVSLFISIAATMVAFSAALSLLLRDKIRWIVAPVILLASVPVTLFLMLQYPLLVELVRSTYGRGIFYKQNNVLLF